MAHMKPTQWDPERGGGVRKTKQQQKNEIFSNLDSFRKNVVYFDEQLGADYTKQ